MRVAIVAACLIMSAPTVSYGADWAVDVSKSEVRFEGTQGSGKFSGTLPFTAKIKFDPDALAASSVAVTLNVAKADTGDKERDGAIRQPDWFDVAKYPTATFTSSKMKSLGGNQYEAEGTLTLKGMTRPVKLPFTLAITGNKAVMNGQLTLNRHDFKVGVGQWASDQWVGRDVVVKVRLEAQKK